MHCITCPHRRSCHGESACCLIPPSFSLSAVSNLHFNLNISLLALQADARDLLDKSSAPGQQKKPGKNNSNKGNGNGKGNGNKGNGNGHGGKGNANPNAKFNRPESDWNCTPESPHPKCQHANPNAAFNRGTFRDPSSDSSDWEDVIDNEIPPIPGPISPTPDPNPTPTPDPTPMSSAQRRRAESLTNVFEFSSVNPDYGYAEYLGDGRGITFGRCGFTTGTGDGLVVVREFTRRKPDNPLAKFLPALERIDAAKSGESNDDVTGLTGFVQAVKSIGNDKDFKDAQDWAHENMYWLPSQRASDVLGLKYPLSRAQMFDAYFMHGENSINDAFYPKSANGMAAWVNTKLGGSPATGVDEKQWISTYMARRKAVLTSSGKVWEEAANRIEIYQWLQTAVVYNLDRTIKLSESGCGSDGVCAVSANSVTVGPSTYGSFTIN
jgi:chitosanase